MAKNLKPSEHEGETPLDDLSGLLIKIKNQKELNVAESINNAEAYAKHLLFVKPAALKWTHQFLTDLHRDMFGSVWSWAGEKRRSEKNLGVAPAKISFEIDRFLHELHQWEKDKIEPFEIAVRLHHRLVQIHPFENGNGRWARLATNLYLHRRNLSIIEWPTDERVVREEFRPKYLAALKQADHGNYDSLLTLHRQHS